MKRQATLVVLFLLGSLPTEGGAQTCNTSIPETTPTARYEDNGDGTVTDLHTSLMWMRCPLGFTWNSPACLGSLQEHDWQAALKAAEGVNYAGHGDWRLPNIKELESIVERKCHLPAINLTVFPGVPEAGQFWTSSPSTHLFRDAWKVDFTTGTGDVLGKSNEEHVRLVRELP